MKRSHVFLVVLVCLVGGASLAKTDVRALVSRPKDSSKRVERKCRTDSQCELIQCHSPCGFDDVANHKYVKKIVERCADEKKASGDDLIVDCAESSTRQDPKCLRGYCVIAETSKAKPVVAEPELKAPKH